MPRNSLFDEAMSLFENWYREAENAADPQTDAMVLATVSATGWPSARVVLLKGISGGGFTFFTNYESKKSEDLAANSKAAIVFYWPTIQKQVRVEGAVEKVTRSESESYFHTRPRGSQIGAWASEQSRVIPDREHLEARVLEFTKSFEGGEVPCPSHWGGFRLKPMRFEFWEGRESRLHDRRVFRLSDGGDWVSERLAP